MAFRRVAKESRSSGIGRVDGFGDGSEDLFSLRADLDELLEILAGDAGDELLVTKGLYKLSALILVPSSQN